MILAGADNRATREENPILTASPFVPGTSIQFAWDSTSLTVAMSCAYKYKLEIIEGWVPKDPNVAVALAFGILLHSGVEQYHRARLGGQGFDEAVVTALEKTVSHHDSSYDRGPLYESLPVEDDIEEMKEAADDEDDGIDLRNSRVRTRYHLLRALVWYFEQYRQDHLQVVTLASGAPAVEYSFRVPVGETLSDGTDLILSGHLDKVVELNGDLFVSDVKTTKSLTRSYRDGFSLSHQMTGYTLGGRLALERPVSGVFIDAIALQVGGVKFSRFTTHRTESQLKEYLRVFKYLADQAEMWYQTSYYPQNTSACMFCSKKSVCAKPPEFRAAYLQTYFQQKPAWNPLKSR